jgi:hypothetical protein
MMSRAELLNQAGHFVREEGFHKGAELFLALIDGRFTSSKDSAFLRQARQVLVDVLSNGTGKRTWGK